MVICRHKTLRASGNGSIDDMGHRTRCVPPGWLEWSLLVHWLSTCQTRINPINIPIQFIQKWANLHMQLWWVILNILWSLSGHVQDWECTRCPGACRALTDLRRVTQGECVPAEWLSRNVITYRLEYVHEGDFTCLEMRRKLPSHSTQVWLYIMDG